VSAPGRSTTDSGPGCLSMVVFLLVIPIALGYLLFVLALRAGATGDNVKNRGTAVVANCSDSARMFGLMKRCDATDVVLGKHYPDGPTQTRTGQQTVLTASSVHGRIAVVEDCVPLRGYIVTTNYCSLYPASFPRSVWWSWAGYLTIPVAVFVYFTVRARADSTQLRRRARRRDRRPATDPTPRSANDVPPTQEEQT
jgi:hypothetical protein